MNQSEFCIAYTWISALLVKPHVPALQILANPGKALPRTYLAAIHISFLVDAALLLNAKYGPKFNFTNTLRISRSGLLDEDNSCLVCSGFSKPAAT